jgi:membrane protease YdiL (CAAX protease family)
VLQPLPDFVGRAWQPAADRPVWAVLSLFFAWLVINLLAAIAIKAGALSEAKAELVATGLACLVILLWLLRLHRQVAPGLRHVGKWWWYPLCVALGLATFAVATGAVRVLVHLLHIEELQYARPLLEAGYGWPMVLLMVCVQPAVFEELAFRGAILEVLRGLLGLRDAIVVTALLFMVLHLAVLSFPHLLLIGLVLGYVRTRSGSLYPCMVLHFTHNLLVVLAEMKGP